jgi:hypothetical protein
MLNATLAKEPNGVVCYAAEPLRCKVDSFGPVAMPSIGVEGGL